MTELAQEKLSYWRMIMWSKLGFKGENIWFVNIAIMK